jgi:hypothetical protein
VKRPVTRDRFLGVKSRIERAFEIAAVVVLVATLAIVLAGLAIEAGL